MNLNLNLPDFKEDDFKTEKGIKAVMDYLYMLNDQLKYTLSHLNMDENFDSDSIQRLLNMSESITLVADSIKLYAKKGELSAELSLEDGVVSLKGNRVVISSDNFNLSADGTIQCTNGIFSGSFLTYGSNGYTVYMRDGVMRCVDSTQRMWIEIQPGLIQIRDPNGTATLTSMAGHFVNGVSAASLYGNLQSTYVVPNFGSDAYGAFTNLQSLNAASTFYVQTAAQNIAANLIAGALSDFRLKKDVMSLESIGNKEKWLSLLDGVKIKSFSYKPDTYILDDGKQHLGVIAQQLEKILEEKGLEDYGLIKELDYSEKSRAGEYTGGEKAKSVDYVGMVPLLILGYQETKKESRELKQEIQELRQEIEALKRIVKGE